MAATVSDYKTLSGPSPFKSAIFTVTHTGATSSEIKTADHGFNHIAFVVANNRTTEAAGLVQKNVNSSAEAERGTIYTSSVVDGDVVDYYIMGN